jgi:serine/threonine protein kinase
LYTYILDIKLGTILGAGEFGAVYQIDSFQKKKGGCGCNTICGDRPSSSITLPKETAPVITQQQSRATSSANSGTDIPPLVLLLEASAIVVPSMSSSKEELDDDNDNNDDDAISDLDENEDMLNEHDGEVDYLREYLIHHVYRCGQYRYAMKRLRKTESLRCDPVDAMIDMAFEARILSSISHPNIVKIRAIMGTPGQPENFGIIMDRLNETLREKIDAWTMSEKKDNRGWSLLQRFVGPGKNTVARQTKSDLLLERFLAVYDIARALKYLHEKK